MYIARISRWSMRAFIRKQNMNYDLVDVSIIKQCVAIYGSYLRYYYITGAVYRRETVYSNGGKALSSANTQTVSSSRTGIQTCVPSPG